MLSEASWLLKGLNMNVVVSNQAVLEKNSPLFLTSPFFPILFLQSAFFSSGNAPGARCAVGAQQGSQRRAEGPWLGETRALKSKRFRMDMVNKIPRG